MPNTTRRHNFTKRDRRILEAIHYTYDGMLGAHQIMRLEFTSWRMTRGRLSSLYKAGYLDRPDIRQRAGLDDMPYWLGEKGATILAEAQGMSLNEFYYRKKPRWSQINHDLAVNTFQMDVRDACKFSDGRLELIEWVTQGEFWRNPDTIEYRNEEGTKNKRGIRPDGYFAINMPGQLYPTARFLVEIDMSTEDNPRFAREKTIPLIAYLKSKIYKKRFGKTGRVLVVTTSTRRLANMKRQTEKVLSETEAKWFCFTTFDQVSFKTLFSKPIWSVGAVAEAVSLLDRKVWAKKS